jgi:peptidoglycan hydrolase-like protein with peptidoglycan-binding domain
VSKSNVTLEQLMEGISRPTGAVHDLVVQRIRTLVWDLGEPYFSIGSAVLLPGLELQPKQTVAELAPLQALKHVFDLAAQNSAMKLLVVGHCARAETPAEELANKRAESVLALLKGDRAAFAAACALHVPRDIQLVLQWAALVHGLGCRPGKADGIIGPKTQAAIKRFRAAYNRQFSGQLAEDGEWATPDWEAVYDLYDVSLARQLKVAKSELGNKRSSLKFDAEPSLGCAAHWTVGAFGCAGQRARTSRRAEVLLVEDKPHGDLNSTKYGPPGWEIYAHNLRFKRKPAPAPEPAEWLTLESDFALNLTVALANELTARAFAFWGRAVFGADIPRSAFEQLHADLRAGAVQNVKHKVSAGLTGHRAAYEAKTQTTLISEDLLSEARADQTGYAATLACVLVEEFGHYLDSLLRNQYTHIGGDAPSDEGARFAYLLLLETMATPGLFDVATLHVEGEAEPIQVDMQEVRRVIKDVLGPFQQGTDEQQAGLEFADEAPASGGTRHHVIETVDDLEPSLPHTMQAPEAKEILYFSLLTAGYSITDVNALVDLARKLNERWRGTSGPSVIYELHKARQTRQAPRARAAYYLAQALP